MGEPSTYGPWIPCIQLPEGDQQSILGWCMKGWLQEKLAGNDWK